MRSFFIVISSVGTFEYTLGFMSYYISAVELPINGNPPVTSIVK